MVRRSVAAGRAAVLSGFAALAACSAAPEKAAEAPRAASAAAYNPAVTTTPNPTAPPFRLVMLGDSLTAGYGLPAEEALPVKLQEALQARGDNIVIINAGVSGDTMADGLARLDWALGQPADGILVALGGNDLLRGVDPAATDKALQEILTRAKARGLILMVAGMRAPENYGADFRARFDALFPADAKAAGAALYPFLLAGVAGKPALLQADTIHANPKGVAVMVEGLAPFVEGEVKANGRPTTVAP